MKEQLANIRSQALAAIEGAADPAALDALRVQYLGKKGELTNGPAGQRGPGRSGRGH